MTTTARRERWIERIRQTLPYEHRSNPTVPGIRTFFEERHRESRSHRNWTVGSMAFLAALGETEIALATSGFLLAFVVGAYLSKVPDEAIEEYVRRETEKPAAAC